MTKQITQNGGGMFSIDHLIVEKFRKPEGENLIVVPQQGVLFIEEEVEEPPRFLEGLDKLSQRESPWEGSK